MIWLGQSLNVHGIKTETGVRTGVEAAISDIALGVETQEKTCKIEVRDPLLLVRVPASSLSAVFVGRFWRELS